MARLPKSKRIGCCHNRNGAPCLVPAAIGSLNENKLEKRKMPTIWWRVRPAIRHNTNLGGPHPNLPSVMMTEERFPGSKKEEAGRWFGFGLVHSAKASSKPPATDRMDHNRPMLRGIFAFEDEETPEWRRVVLEDGAGGVPKFATKSECEAFIRRHCARGSNPDYKNLQHVFSMLVDWKQVWMDGTAALSTQACFVVRCVCA